MGTSLITLAFIGAILIIAAFVVKFKREEGGYSILGFGLGILFSVLIIGLIYSLSIQPIDVYRGKTTLQVTYEDSIPIDSVVIYKNK